MQFNRVLPDEQRIVKLSVGLPPSNGVGYEFDLQRSEVVHMALASEQLVVGMHYPNKFRGSASTLSMIPKFTDAPLSLDAGAEGWGVHALQRFSLTKIIWWIAGITLFGFIFVVLWLVYVSRTDLQNAFVPYTFLASMLVFGLAIPQILDVD